jgi:CVNH domain
MTFSASCHSLSLEGKSKLSALCRNERGEFCASTLDLNHYLSNCNGEFYWKYLGTGFADSAKDVRLDGAVLLASLPSDHGVLTPAHLNLNFCIANVNGKLVFKKP